MLKPLTNVFNHALMFYKIYIIKLDFMLFTFHLKASSDFVSRWTT